MSLYTLKGSDALDERISIHLEHIVKTVAPFCTAVILVGGYGRGEGTPFILPDGKQLPFNDYDLVVIVDTLNDAVRLEMQSLEHQLTQDLGLPVDLCPYQRSTLYTREYSLFNYEMKYGHRVLRGDSGILDVMPEYTLDAIPLSEGSRLLLNRGKLLLDIKRRLSTATPLVIEERIRFKKFLYKVLLAFGDCALLSAGQYDILYTVKKERIEMIGDCPERTRIIQGYREAVELKEWGDFQDIDAFDIEVEYRRVRDLFQQFFPWYRRQSTSAECSLMKAMVLNVKYNGRPLLKHPRLYLYDALSELLQDDPDELRLNRSLFTTSNHPERFYRLQKRFS